MKDLKQLQSQRDELRSKGKRLSKEGKWDELESLQKSLEQLDGLFFRLCESRGLKLSKSGRL